MSRRATVLALAVAGLFAAPASALAALDVAVEPNEARYGDSHHAVGRMTDATGAPLADRRIALEKRDYPFTGDFRPIGHATTDADGRFTFDDVELSRNADLRVVAFDGTTSGIARAFTYPAFTLQYRPVDVDLLRVTQVYTTPRSVRLKAPTYFYFGNADAARSSLRVIAKTRRISAGRFRATARVHLPHSWKGRFKYASCFGYSDGSGMGDPARGCSRRFDF